MAITRSFNLSIDYKFCSQWMPISVKFHKLCVWLFLIFIYIELQNAGAKENLDCKYCNTFFTYKAPTKKALIHHLKSLHEKELAEESPAYRKEIFGNDFLEKQLPAKAGAPLTPNPTETSVIWFIRIFKKFNSKLAFSTVWLQL